MIITIISSNSSSKSQNIIRTWLNVVSKCCNRPTFATILRSKKVLLKKKKKIVSIYKNVLFILFILKTY